VNTLVSSRLTPDHFVPPRGPRLRFFRRDGEASAPCLLMLHGFTDSAASFSPLVPHLPAEWRLLALDLRGHGGSGEAPSAYRLADFASDAAALLDHLGVATATIAGHSLGGAVALRLGIDHGARVAKLVLLASAASWRCPAVAELRCDLDAMSAAPSRAFVSAFQRSTIHRPIDEALFQGFVDASMRLPLHAWREILAALVEGDLESELRAITSPCLAIHGDRDLVCDAASQDALLAGIRDCRLVSLVATGHAVHWERPREVAATIARFVAG
jgi:pimeloyl-ACP methyl ester carboxylesterase